jgi:signal transduction histidine kinase
MATENAELLIATSAIQNTNSKPNIIIATRDGALDEAYLLHDLKNHLQVIGSALNIVHRGVKFGVSKHDGQAMTVAHAALEKACALIITLTDRKMAEDVEGFSNVDQILSDMLPLIQVVMGNDVQIGLDCAAPHTLNSCTTKQFENAVLNLALNAREAMPNGGRLEVTSRIVSGANVGDRAALCIAVRDTGAGMDAQTLTLAGHDRFTTRTGRGGGLGLASIRDFACSAGGRFDIESEKGIGTTVRLQLPL